MQSLTVWPSKVFPSLLTRCIGGRVKWMHLIYFFSYFLALSHQFQPTYALPNLVWGEYCSASLAQTFKPKTHKVQKTSNLIPMIMHFRHFCLLGRVKNDPNSVPQIFTCLKIAKNELRDERERETKNLRVHMYIHY